MRSSLLCFVLLLACHAAPSAATPSAATGPIKRVVLVTVDGLMPDSYLHPDAHGLQVPTLRRIVREGAYGDGAQGVLPTVTYPSHTSIATGVLPATHGIVGNRPFDPLQQNQEGWYWYAEDIAVPALWDVARAAGLHTALVNWPVSVGAKVDWLAPEYWRARQPDDVKLLRALSTPGFLDAVPNLTLPPSDAWLVDLASHAIAQGRPELVLLHIAQVDEAQHHGGPWSSGALAAIENADAQLARLIAAVDRAGLAHETAFVIASDHGFAPVTRQVHPNAALREAGFITTDAKGKPIDYRAAGAFGGGLNYVYVRDQADEEKVRQLLASRGGIARIFTREELRARGGDPKATFALEAEPGVYFGASLSEYETPAPVAGMHGYDPERPEMHASLLWFGPGVKPGLRQGTRLIDIAPTIASWLGLTLAGVDGRVLN